MGFEAPTLKNYRDQSLDRLLNGLDQLSNKVVANNERAILDSINVLVRDSGNFDSQEDFDNVNNLIDSIDDNWLFNNSVVKSNVYAYKTALDSVEKNFQVNNELNAMLDSTKVKLVNLNEETSTGLPAILQSLEQFNSSYLKHANHATIKRLNDTKDDIRDAIWSSHRLNIMDLSPDDPGYELAEANTDTEVGLFYYLNGDHKEARKYLNKGIRLDERELFKNAGTNYHNAVKKVVHSISNANSAFKRDLDMDDYQIVRSSGLYSHMVYMPQTGAYKMNQNNIGRRKDEWTQYIANIMLDDSIKWSEDGEKLLTAYRGTADPATGGVGAFYDMLEFLVAEELGFVKDGKYNPKLVTEADKINYLNKNVTWSKPVGLFGKEITPGINFSGSTLFNDVINTWRTLDNEIALINKYRDKGLSHDFGSGTSGLFDEFD